VLQSGHHERNQADANHYQRKLAWAYETFGLAAPVDLDLKELIDGEAERDQRSRGPGPGHHRPVMGEPRAIEGESCRDVERCRICRSLIFHLDAFFNCLPHLVTGTLFLCFRCLFLNLTSQKEVQESSDRGAFCLDIGCILLQKIGS